MRGCKHLYPRLMKSNVGEWWMGSGCLTEGTWSSNPNASLGSTAWPKTCTAGGAQQDEGDG